MHFDVLTLFPKMLESWQSQSLVGRACVDQNCRIDVHDLKNFSGRQDGRIDDRPYGGGPGMVFRPEPVMAALESIKGFKEAKKIHLSPAGRLWTQADAVRFSHNDHVIFLCSRYEGVDERALSLGKFEEVSIGDYVVMGGEIPAMIVMESIIRLLNGVLGCQQSASEDSFSPGRKGLLDCPHYTRPDQFRGLSVPEVLLSGDHGKIDLWRQQESKKRTQSRRPDLI